MGKHTPGPWSPFIAGRRGKRIIAVTGPKHLDVPGKSQEIVHWSGFDSSHINSEQERIANARLIAASPEMCEILKVMAESDANIKDFAAARKWFALCADARAVLSKINGEG